jgi:hypothetical protein
MLGGNRISVTSAGQIGPKSARCVRRGGDWKRGMVEML